VLDRVALTGSPSNKEATVFIARSIPKTPEVKVADPVVDEAVARQIADAVAAAKADFEATQRAKDERIAALEADKAARDEQIARSECATIAAEFKSIGAKDVDVADLIYRSKKAGIDDDLVKLLRAANARAKVGTEALSRTVGHNGEADSAIPADLVGIVTPKHMADAGGSVLRAVLSATEDARKSGNNAHYEILRSYKVS